MHAPTRRHPATLPPQSRRASDPATHPPQPTPTHVIPAIQAGIHRAGRRPSPHVAVAQRPPAQQTRKGGPHARRWTQTRPCWRSCNVPPPGATPPSPICGRHPLGQPTQQGTQAAVNQRRIIQQPRQGCPHQETIAVLPPGQLQKPTKNTKQSYKGRLIIRHFCSPGRPSSPTTCCALSPTWPSR